MGNQYQYAQNEPSPFADTGNPGVLRGLIWQGKSKMQHDLLLTHSQLTPTSDLVLTQLRTKQKQFKTNIQQGGRVGKIKR